ncbi:hypothetical protein CR513_28437, partial [Mucuna pruriens]
MRRLAMRFFLNGDVLYKRNLDITLLQCVDINEAKEIVKEVHKGSLGTHANEHTMARKILRGDYFWLNMEADCCNHASNGHHFILVAIDYFTKWMKAASYANVTKVVVVKFIRRDLICQYGLLSDIIIDNETKINNRIMEEL